MGADTTVPEKDGYTPMHGAGFQGRAEIAKILLDHGVDKGFSFRFLYWYTNLVDFFTILCVAF